HADAGFGRVEVDGSICRQPFLQKPVDAPGMALGWSVGDVDVARRLKPERTQQFERLETGGDAGKVVRDAPAMHPPVDDLSSKRVVLPASLRRDRLIVRVGEEDQAAT